MEDVAVAGQLIKAIDVHAHYGDYVRGPDERRDDFMSRDADFVVRCARLANTECSVVSPLQALMPRGGGDPVSGNTDAAAVVAETEGLLQWVVIDPAKPQTYEQAADMLQTPKCVGIKIHPEEHVYPVSEHAGAVFEFAARYESVILTHSGEQNSLPGDMVTFADEFPEVRLIVAHLGHGWDGDLSHQVRAIQASRHGNVFTDTSSQKSLTPGLIEWAVREVGAEHLLYGSDSPCYFAPMQRARIDYAEISQFDKQLILRDNAVKLLQIKGDSHGR